MQPAFEVGEVVNPEDWGLRVRVTSVEPLEVVVIKNDAPPGDAVGKFFPVGKTLRFVRARPDDLMSWRIDASASDMPWYLLHIYGGRKRFEHYR